MSDAPRSVTRALALFDILAGADEGMTLAELSAALNSPKSSLLLLLRPLAAEGFLLHANSRYQLGPMIYKLASTISSTRNFTKLIRPYIEELARKTSESVYLAVIDRDNRVGANIEGIDCQQAVRYVPPIGQARPLYCTAPGRLLLAHQDKAWLDSYLRSVKLKPLTSRTITDLGDLKKELKRIREEGISVSIGETSEGAAGISAPIWNADGTLAAALLIAAPEHRFLHRAEEFRQLLTEIAARASGEVASVRRSYSR